MNNKKYLRQNKQINKFVPHPHSSHFLSFSDSLFSLPHIFSASTSPSTGIHHAPPPISSPSQSRPKVQEKCSTRIRKHQTHKLSLDEIQEPFEVNSNGTVKFEKKMELIICCYRSSSRWRA